MERLLGPEDKIKFDCNPSLSCFTKCCSDVNIILNPYDVLRMKNALKITSTKFLEKYTHVLYKEKGLIPVVILKMREDKRCPFVSKYGCIIYHDRPWACRMFPLDPVEEGRFRLLVGPERCFGLREKKEWKVEEWLKSQGIEEYEEMNRGFFEITKKIKALETEVDDPKVREMIFMSLYDIDRFREFILKTSFFERFELNQEIVKENDKELLKLGYNWIKFGLFGEMTLKLRRYRND